jgi:3-deoxy-D-manno-octulosonate 8-phosphate phosphatase (KDO 8-P phosphatase)
MNSTEIELLILDVDGVLTDGRITTATDGEVTKTFHVQDGCAIKLWQRVGGKVAILSGRSEAAVKRRAVELGVPWCHIGAADKLAGYHAILAEAGCGDDVTGYLGDDLADVALMSRCGFPVAVADAAAAVKRAAMYVTRRRGGEGAVAEVVELLMRKTKRWSRTLLEKA